MTLKYQTTPVYISVEKLILMPQCWTDVLLLYIYNTSIVCWIVSSIFMNRDAKG